MSGPVLSARSLSKSFDGVEVLKAIDLDIEEGERIAVLGSSGSGKSTLLRCLNFMERPTAGRVLLDGKAVGREAGASIRYDEAELRRLRIDVGMVFQGFNLFPHMTALQNVMEALMTVRRMPRAAAQAEAEAQLAGVNMGEKAGSYPGHLSGGQQQRVAIARALAMQPRVLLLDEPTSSLDPELVGEVLRVINGLSAQRRTMVLVTHELGFAYHFATRIVFLHEGRIHEQGPPDQVLKQPRQQRTRDFLARFNEFAF